MKVSTKGRYGLRIMLELALRYEKNLLTAREIAEQQEISDKYIEQIIGSLTKGGLVRSQRGAGGGYRLALAPEHVTVRQVLSLTEGHLLNGEPDTEPEPREKSVTDEVWTDIAKAVCGVVDNITLYDLVARHNELFNFAYMI